MGRRNQRDRDAITVEIGYALVSATFAAAVVFGAVAGPKLAFTMPYAVERGLFLAGLAAAAIVFALRVVTVLWRFARPGDEPNPPYAADASEGSTGSRPARRPDQSNQPGRRGPDS
ncbi:DUF6332 family protein [Streptomyces sp. NPDC020141]|uniref:DUF6332 family protein n=1 Tax=Streptomyces sp. NPDC020141 TaxID=3365065 RepID=UPI0037955FF1